MASFRSLLARRDPEDPKDNVWKQNERRFQGYNGRARADAVIAASGNAKSGVSKALYGKGDGAGRARIITFMTVGKGRIQGERDSSPTTADLVECVNDYGLNTQIQSNVNLLQKWLFENVYPIPSGYPKSTFHMIYYNKRLTGGIPLFNWSAFTGVLRRFILQTVVHVKKGADSARTVMNGLMRVKEIYKKHLNVSDNEESGDPWCQLMNAYFIWYSQAHLAAGGEPVENPFAVKQFGPDGNQNIVGALKKSHKDASVMAMGVAGSAIFGIEGYENMGKDPRIPFYQNALRSAVQANVSTRGQYRPGWATSSDTNRDAIGDQSFQRILAAMQSTFNTARDKNFFEGKNVRGGDRKTALARKPLHAKDIEARAKEIGARRKKLGFRPSLSASERIGANKGRKRAAQFARLTERDAREILEDVKIEQEDEFGEEIPPEGEDMEIVRSRADDIAGVIKLLNDTTLAAANRGDIDARREYALANPVAYAQEGVEGQQNIMTPERRDVITDLAFVQALNSAIAGNPPRIDLYAFIGALGPSLHYSDDANKVKIIKMVKQLPLGVLEKEAVDNVLNFYNPGE